MVKNLINLELSQENMSQIRIKICQEAGQLE